MKSNIIKIDSVKVEKGTKLIIEFSVEGEVKAAFKSSLFEAEYDLDISTVPKSILVIPFIVNVLPIAWVYDAWLCVDELDEDFFGQILGIKGGYQAMYPGVVFGGEVTTDALIKNRVNRSGSAGLLFSGGVDATSSFTSMINEGKRPHLITLWGADIDLSDDAGWKEKKSHTKNVAKLFGLDSSLVKTNFRKFINEVNLDNMIRKNSGDMWWHGFQHGIGIIGHSAPIVYVKGLDVMYIAASFTRGETETCASDPSIDEQVIFAGTNVVHDGYDFSRQDKIKNIHDFTVNRDIDTLPIKVCWLSSGGKNCGKCEKCIRTACGFLVEGARLDVYELEGYSAKYARNYILRKHHFAHVLHWEKIQKRLNENMPNLNEETKPLIDWLIKVNFKKINNNLVKKLRRYPVASKRAIVGAMPRALKDYVKRNISKG